MYLQIALNIYIEQITTIYKYYPHYSFSFPLIIFWNYEEKISLNIITDALKLAEKYQQMFDINSRITFIFCIFYTLVHDYS